MDNLVPSSLQCISKEHQQSAEEHVIVEGVEVIRLTTDWKSSDRLSTSTGIGNSAALNLAVMCLSSTFIDTHNHDAWKAIDAMSKEDGDPIAKKRLENRNKSMHLRKKKGRA